MAQEKYRNELYDTYINIRLPYYPSLTFQWCNDYNEIDRTQTFVVSTDSDGRFPNDPLRIGEVKFDEDHKAGSVEIVKLFPLEHSAHIAKYSPNFRKIVACTGMETSVFDTDGESGGSPLLQLRYHSAACWSLDWSPYDPSVLAIGSNDKSISLWDFFHPPNDCGLPLWQSFDLDGIVNQLNFDPKRYRVIGAAIESGDVCIYDTRKNLPGLSYRISKSGINAISFNSNSEHLLASGDVTGNIFIHDLRKPNVPLHKIKGHGEQITRIQWNPNYDSVLATAGADSRTRLWDIKRIGTEQDEDDWLDGPPELLFTFNHFSPVLDMDWNPYPNQMWNLGTVEESDNLAIWTPHSGVISSGGENGQIHPTKIIPDAWLEY